MLRLIVDVQYAYKIITTFLCSLLMSYATFTFSDLLQVGCLSGLHTVDLSLYTSLAHPCSIGMLYAICLIIHALQSFVLSGLDTSNAGQIIPSIPHL